MCCDQLFAYITHIHILQLSFAPIVFDTHLTKPMLRMPVRHNCAIEVSNSWYVHKAVTYIMHNTLYYVCNTPVMCYIHNKILCDIRQQQHQCFLCMQGQQYFSWDIFLWGGLEIFETPVILAWGGGRMLVSLMSFLLLHIYKRYSCNFLSFCNICEKHCICHNSSALWDCFIVIIGKIWVWGLVGGFQWSNFIW